MTGEKDQLRRRGMETECPGTARVRKNPGIIWDREIRIRERIYAFVLYRPKRVNANGREKPGEGTGKHSKR